jgi:hypothetical protein
MGDVILARGVRGLVRRACGWYSSKHLKEKGLEEFVENVGVAALLL